MKNLKILSTKWGEKRVKLSDLDPMGNFFKLNIVFIWQVQPMLDNKLRKLNILAREILNFPHFSLNTQDAFQGPRCPQVSQVRQERLRRRGESGGRIQVAQSLLQML